jgi:hypothetical protein
LKKYLLIENFRHQLGWKAATVIGVACVLAAIVTEKELAGGFICGAAAFGFAAISLEQLALRIIEKGDVVRGVRSGLFWLVFKFIGPAVLIFLGLSRGYSPAAAVVGMLSGLVVFSVILWRSRRKKF